MTYLRAYVNKMLENHPHGDTFKKIRELARHVEDYEPPIPEPEVDEQTRKQRISNSVLQILLSMLGLVVLSALSDDGFGRRNANKRVKLHQPKYYEQLKQKLSELMDVLDCSKESKWLATYMIDEGASGCPLAVRAFEEYLEKCGLNP